MKVELKEADNGDTYFELPDEIIKKFNLKEGDDIEIEAGKIE